VRPRPSLRKSKEAKETITVALRTVTTHAAVSNCPEDQEPLETPIIETVMDFKALSLTQVLPKTIIKGDKKAQR